MPTTRLPIEGLSCSDCAARIEAAVSALPEVNNATIDLISGTLQVDWQGEALPLSSIDAIVRETGHTLRTDSPRPDQPAWRIFFRFLTRTGETRSLLIAILFFLLALIGRGLNLPPGWEIGLFGTAILIGGTPVARHAWQELRWTHRPGINTLMVIAVLGAIALNDWIEASVVVILFSLGEALESYSADRARASIDALLSLAPSTVLRLHPDGITEPIPTESVQVGDTILVRAGDRIGVDGIVREGDSTVDQAPITGESIPVDKTPGDEVFAGTINLTGTLIIEVTRPPHDDTLHRMVTLIREARANRANIQTFLERFAAIYTPTVALIALLVATLPPLLTQAPFWGPSGWFNRALQILVIACPCALVISTPVSLVSAIAGAARQGILIKGGRYLEILAQVKTIAFDKTGTLTQGRPITTDILSTCTCGECPADCGLQHAAALENQSTHPLAQAIMHTAREHNVPIPPAENVQVLAGRGIEGRVNGQKTTVGSHTYFDQHLSHELQICQQAQELESQGKTVILVRHGDETCAIFGIADQPRPESRETIETLRKMGIHTVMLTGDTPIVATAIASEIGIDHVRASLLPEDKLKAIIDLQKRHGPIAMVGDGINDAPALARADVGIAMGAAGTAQAMETAQIVLMGDNLSHIPALIHLARRTRRVIHTNIAMALSTKLLVFFLALLGLANLWMAISADVGVSLLVILNGLRLRRGLPNTPQTRR